MQRRHWLYRLLLAGALLLVGGFMLLARPTQARVFTIPTSASAPLLHGAPTLTHMAPMFNRGTQPPTHAVAAPVSRNCQPIWSVVPTHHSGYLGGIAAVAPDDIWAVGYATVGYLASSTLIEHWDGTQWSIVPSPSPGNSGSYLYKVAAVSADDVWAVGSYSDLDSPGQTLIEHWDGVQWSIIPNPNPGASGNGLSDVAVINSSDVWAVGTYIAGTFAQTLVEHWNGSVWNIVPSPNIAGADSILSGVAAVGTADIWAVGYVYSGFQDPLTMHWDGVSWSIVPGPSGFFDTSLSGVSAVSARDVWAVGHNSDATFVEHWDGNQWDIIPSPNLGSGRNGLFGITFRTANDIWAAGIGNDRQSLVENWDGNRWSIVSTPDVEGALNAVAILSAGDIWVVGGNGTEALHYAPACAAAPAQPAQVWVGLQQDPDQAVAPGGLFTYTLTVRNDGPGVAGGTGVRIALDPNVEVLDFHSPDSRIYVDYVGDDAVSVLFHDLGQGAAWTAQIIARVRPTAAMNTAITSQATAYWDDTRPHRTRRSNSITITVGPVADSGRHGLQQALAVDPAGAQTVGTAIQMAGGFFGEEETVSFWLNRPDGQVTALPGLGRADMTGRVTLTVDTTGLAAGAYTVVAHGWGTGVEGVGAFTLR